MLWLAGRNVLTYLEVARELRNYFSRPLSPSLKAPPPPEMGKNGEMAIFLSHTSLESPISKTPPPPPKWEKGYSHTPAPSKALCLSSFHLFDFFDPPPKHKKPLM